MLKLQQKVMFSLLDAILVLLNDGQLQDIQRYLQFLRQILDIGSGDLGGGPGAGGVVGTGSLIQLDRVLSSACSEQLLGQVLGMQRSSCFQN